MIEKNLNFAAGLVNAFNPASPLYPEGAAYNSNNLRLDEDNCWRHGPSLANMKLAGDDTRTAIGNIVKASNNVLFTCLGGSVAGGAGTAVEAPSISVAVSALTGTRQEGGLYYYMAVNYDSTNKLESLPSTVKEHWVRRYYSGDVRQPDVPHLSGGTASTRWYRSKVVKIHKGDTMQLGQINSPTDFYFLGSGATWDDYASDNEIANPENLYAGRGSFRPTSNVDAIGSFNNRMFYFVDNVAYFSSAGRPEEVPQEYILTISCSYSNGTWTGEVLTAGNASEITLTRKPLLDTGLYAPAKMAILELVGRTVVRAEEINGKFWIYTADSMGYITPTDNLEGFRYVHVAEGFGLGNAWTLSVTPYGIFGADVRGIWLFTDRPKRLNTDKIDIFNSGKDTYIDPSSISTSLGVWIGELNEYLWSCNGKQVVYQVDKERFVGPYNLSLASNVAYLGGLFQCHLIRSGNSPILSTRTSSSATLGFWMGQSASNIIKDQVVIEVLHSQTPGTITLNLYQNSITSKTGATSPAAISYSSILGRISGKSSGRFFMLEATISADSPIAAINYKYNPAASSLGV